MNCPGGKMRFRSKKQATAALHRLHARLDPVLTQRPEYVYRCRIAACRGGWHFTGSEPRGKETV